MPVIINEFEVVAEAPPAPARSSNEPAAEPAPAPPLEPDAVARAWRALEQQALRVWAH